MFTKKDLKELKYIILYCTIVLGVFAYAGLVGWKIFGSNTEQWQADGPHSRSRSHRSHYYHSNHK